NYSRRSSCRVRRYPCAISWPLTCRLSPDLSEESRGAAVNCRGTATSAPTLCLRTCVRKSLEGEPRPAQPRSCADAAEEGR
ncbi:unnamed protein product, partial [Amoebophrya sp. A120]